MKELTLTILILGVSMLAGCVNTPVTRTDRINVQLILDVVSYEETQRRCEFDFIVRGCTKEGRVIMYGWDEATYTAKLNVQFLDWSAIGKKCGRAFGKPSCYDPVTATLYTYDYPSDRDYHMGVIGDILADEILHLEPSGSLNRNATLGHEFMAHVLGSGDVGRYSRELIRRNQ